MIMTPNGSMVSSRDGSTAFDAALCSQVSTPAWTSCETRVSPSFPLEDFAVEYPRLGSTTNILGMQMAAWTAVGLSRTFGSRAQGKLGILTYHRVLPRISRLPAPSHNVTPDRFRAHVSGLLERGFTFWPLQKLLRHRQAKAPLPPRTIALTFDDGFQSVYTEAFPILRELRVPATLFLATGYLDRAAPFPFDLWGTEFSSQLPPEACRPVTLDQCREMADSGIIDFGAHTHTHRDLRGRPEEFQADVQTSVDFVRRAFSLDDVMFAFPYGSKHRGFAAADLVAAAKQTGVNCGLTTECSLVDLSSDPFGWGRFNVFAWDTAATLAGKLDGWFTWASQLKRAVSSNPSRSSTSSRPVKRPTLAERQAIRSPKCNGWDRSRFLKTEHPTPIRASDRLAQAHVVCLANILAHHERPVLLELARRVGKLTVLLSSPLGKQGLDTTTWDSLDVRVQKTVTFSRPQLHPLQFEESVDIHVPWNTVAELEDLKPDIVISQESGFRSLLSSYYTLRRRNIPLILGVGMTEHTELGRGWQRYLLRRFLLRRADAIAVNGPGTARYVASLGIDPGRMFHRPYAALPESIAHVPPSRDPASAHHLLYVGQFVERKGLVPFTKELARWGHSHPERKIEFSLIGTGPLEDAIRSVSRPTNVVLNFLGRRQPTEIAHYYGTSGIFVLPTLADEWGMVVNEAMASGLPVLGSVYSQAVDELCKDGAAGWTFRTDVPSEIERAIDAALTTPIEQLDAMRVAARERVAHLTPEYVVDNMVDEMNRLLSQKNPRRPARVSKFESMRDPLDSLSRHETSTLDQRRRNKEDYRTS